MSWGIGKILTGVVIGVGAVAAAPFTGGGSVLGAATLLGSLAGAGTVAAAVGAGVAGAAAGQYFHEEEENARKEELDQKDKEIAKLALLVKKFEQSNKEVLARLKSDKEYFDHIIASSAIGMAMANVDGEILPEELEEINKFIGGIASSDYPEHVKKSIEEFKKNPPDFNTAMAFLEKVKPENRENIRDLIVLVMWADENIHERETAFLQLFDGKAPHIAYMAGSSSEESNKQWLIAHNLA